MNNNNELKIALSDAIINKDKSKAYEIANELLNNLEGDHYLELKDVLDNDLLLFETSYIEAFDYLSKSQIRECLDILLDIASKIEKLTYQHNTSLIKCRDLVDSLLYRLNNSIDLDYDEHEVYFDFGKVYSLLATIYFNENDKDKARLYIKKADEWYDVKTNNITEKILFYVDDKDEEGFYNYIKSVEDYLYDINVCGLIYLTITNFYVINNQEQTAFNIARYYSRYSYIIGESVKEIREYFKDKEFVELNEDEEINFLKENNIPLYPSFDTLTKIRMIFDYLKDDEDEDKVLKNLATTITKFIKDDKLNDFLYKLKVKEEDLIRLKELREKEFVEADELEDIIVDFLDHTDDENKYILMCYAMSKAMFYVPCNDEHKGLITSDGNEDYLMVCTRCEDKELNYEAYAFYDLYHEAKDYSIVINPLNENNIKLSQSTKDAIYFLCQSYENSKLS